MHETLRYFNFWEKTKNKLYLILIRVRSNVTERVILPGTEDGSIKNPNQLLRTIKKDGRYVQERCVLNCLVNSILIAK